MLAPDWPVRPGLPDPLYQVERSKGRASTKVVRRKRYAMRSRIHFHWKPTFLLYRWPQLIAGNNNTGDKTPISSRVSIEISFRKNSAESTRNGSLSSTEKSTPSAECCMPRNSLFHNLEQNGTNGISRKKEVLRNSQHNWTKWLCQESKVWFKKNFMYRRPTLYPLEIAVDFLKSL